MMRGRCRRGAGSPRPGSGWDMSRCGSCSRRWRCRSPMPTPRGGFLGGWQLASVEARPGLRPARHGFKARRGWFQGRGRVGSPDVAPLASSWRWAPAHTAAAALGVSCRGYAGPGQGRGARRPARATAGRRRRAGLRAGRGRRGPGSLHSGNSLSSPVVTSPARYIWPRQPGCWPAARLTRPACPVAG